MAPERSAGGSIKDSAATHSVCPLDYLGHSSTDQAEAEIKDGPHQTEPRIPVTYLALTRSFYHGKAKDALLAANIVDNSQSQCMHCLRLQVRRLCDWHMWRQTKMKQGLLR